jgi:hypothetical protein
MRREPLDVIDEIEDTQDRLHAKWWEIASWLAAQRGADPQKMSYKERVAYAAEIREMTDDGAGATSKPLNATTDLQRLLTEYYEISEQLSELHDELDDLD